MLAQVRERTNNLYATVTQELKSNDPEALGRALSESFDRMNMQAANLRQTIYSKEGEQVLGEPNRRARVLKPKRSVAMPQLAEFNIKEHVFSGGTTQQLEALTGCLV